MTKEKILIVDDEADIGLILKLQLEDAGYQTVRAADGLDALNCLSREKFDLILLDIKMPRMDGLQVLARVQVDYPDVAVVMMTAHGSEDIAVEAMKKGALDYIAKPFSSDDALKKVQQTILFNRTRLENLSLLRELEAERQKTEAILQGMADLLIAVDGEGRIMTVNRSAEVALGMSRLELAGKPITEAVKVDIAPEQLPCLIVLGSAVPCLDVSYNLLAGGKAVPVLSSATPLFDHAGQLIGSVEIIRNISTLKTLEQEKEDFVSMLSHDLKTPITAVVGSIDLVREGRLGPTNDEQCEYLESAIESCNEMVEMIDTLLDIHKFDAGKMVLTYRAEDPAALIHRTLARFQPVAARSQLQLSAKLPKSLPSIMVDRNKFSRLLGNLLSNAFKFTPEGGEIEIVGQVLSGSEFRPRLTQEVYRDRLVADADRYLQIKVQDSGAGIPPASLETIFDRYEQAKSRRQGKAGGTGLGLTFCRKVMDAHEGFIWAESKGEKGSSFHCLFPLERGSGETGTGSRN